MPRETTNRLAIVALALAVTAALIFSIAAYAQAAHASQRVDELYEAWPRTDR